MPSTFTSRLRLEKQNPGENDNTWGTLLNTLLDLMDVGIAGRAAVTHDDTANYSLTTANGTADEARNMILNLGGALTAARNTVVPTVSKLYVVKNATTGGFATTVKTTAGTGISVPNGKTMILFCDGTNVVDAIDYLSTLTVGGATTLLSTLGVTGQATFSAAASVILGTTNKWYGFNDATYAFLTNEASGAGEGIRISATETALLVNGSSVLAGTGTTLTTANAFISDSVVDSTSITSGAIQTDGGAGIAKALWVGGLTNIAGAVTHQSTTVMTGVVGMGNASNSGIQCYVTSSGTKIGFYVDGGGGAMLYSGTNSQTFAAGESATNSVLYVRKDSTSSRSISAAGTLNASGADAAEYRRLGLWVSAPIKKGQVIGYDANGQITDRWSKSAGTRRYQIKTTNPHVVGGDTWASDEEVGERPKFPESTEFTYDGREQPAQLRVMRELSTPDFPPEPMLQEGETPDSFDVRVFGWQEQCMRVEADRSAVAAENARRDAASAQAAKEHEEAVRLWTEDQLAFNARVEEAKAHYEKETLPEYEQALAAREALIEEKRQEVDRIAYNGEVPMITGAAKPKNPGDRVVAIEGQNDSIDVEFIPADALETAPDFETFRALAAKLDRRVGVVTRVYSAAECAALSLKYGSEYPIGSCEVCPRVG